MERISEEEFWKILNFKEPEVFEGKFLGYRNLWDLAAKMVGKALLKYQGKGPGEFKKDPNIGTLYGPYERFERGEISFEDAVRERSWLMAEFAAVIHDDLWRMTLEAQFELQTGKSLKKTLEKLDRGDRRAAIEIVKIFKYPRDKYPPIKRMIREAKKKGDQWFIEAINEAFSSVDLDGDGKLKEYGYLQKRAWLLFLIANQDHMSKHPEEVLKMARGVGLEGFTNSEWENLDDKAKIKREENLKDFLRRYGVKLRQGRPPGTMKRISCFMCKRLFTPIDSLNRICPRCKKKQKVDSHILNSLFPESFAGGTAAPIIQDIEGGRPVKEEINGFYREEKEDETKALVTRVESECEDLLDRLDRLEKMRFQKYLFSGWAEDLL